MESEKVKEIKKALELNEYYAIEYFQKSGEPKIFTFTDLLTLINELESENKKLSAIVKAQKYCVTPKHCLEVKALKDRNAELEKDNELLRNAKVVYENVDYCAEDLKKAQDRIAELEEEKTEQLKQFAERLKEYIGHYHGNYGDLSYSECKDIIDETLKEFINKGDN